MKPDARNLIGKCLFAVFAIVLVLNACKKKDEPAVIKTVPQQEPKPYTPADENYKKHEGLYKFNCMITHYNRGWYDTSYYSFDYDFRKETNSDSFKMDYKELHLKLLLYEHLIDVYQTVPPGDDYTQKHVGAGYYVHDFDTLHFSGNLFAYKGVNKDCNCIAGRK